MWMQIRICPDPDGNCECNPLSTGGVEFDGMATSGILKITRCQVSERTPQGEPISLLVDMYFDTTVEGWVQYYPDPPEELTTAVSGWIRSVTVTPLSPLDTFDEYIDAICSDETEEP